VGMKSSPVCVVKGKKGVYTLAGKEGEKGSTRTERQICGNMIGEYDVFSRPNGGDPR